MLAFNSEIEITSETNGNWYIEQLLAKPNVAFRCTHLESLLAGFAEETSTGSIGEVVDMETLRGYRDRLQEIDEELEEATSFNDPARQEKLAKNARPFWIRSSPPRPWWARSPELRC